MLIHSRNTSNEYVCSVSELPFLSSSAESESDEELPEFFLSLDGEEEEEEEGGIVGSGLDWIFISNALGNALLLLLVFGESDDCCCGWRPFDKPPPPEGEWSLSSNGLVSTLAAGLEGRGGRGGGVGRRVWAFGMGRGCGGSNDSSVEPSCFFGCCKGEGEELVEVSCCCFCSELLLFM